MTPSDHHLVASALLRRHGRHDYRVSVVVTAAGHLALVRQWGPVGALGTPTISDEGLGAHELVAAVEALLARLHGRGYAAEDDVAPLLDVAALDAARRLHDAMDPRAIPGLMWPDAVRGPGSSIADALFG